MMSYELCLMVLRVALNGSDLRSSTVDSGSAVRNHLLSPPGNCKSSLESSLEEDEDELEV